MRIKLLLAVSPIRRGGGRLWANSAVAVSLPGAGCRVLAGLTPTQTDPERDRKQRLSNQGFRPL